MYRIPVFAKNYVLATETDSNEMSMIKQEPCQKRIETMTRAFFWMYTMDASMIAMWHSEQNDCYVA